MQNLTTPNLPGDVRDLARLLLTFAPEYQADVAENVVNQAIIANAHRKEHGTIHQFGNGSVMAAARHFGRDLPNEPLFDDVGYIDATIIALTAIRALSEPSYQRELSLEAAE